MTSYVYGANVSAMNPSITFSNASTLINAAGKPVAASGGTLWLLSFAFLLNIAGLV